ncbi:MAG: tetraacyldisaccharide 4'-kinase [Dissulfuribacterales bacterium]
MPVFINPRLLSLLFVCGRPFSPIYASIMKIRAFLYERGVIPFKKLPCPVISIGNITLGGTGKTPHVLAVAQYLANKGLKVAIVTRGYGAKVKDRPFIVFDGEKVHGSSMLCGDEAFMLGESLLEKGVKPAWVIVDSDRYRGGRLACDLGAQVVLLDDGFQHLRLHRDLNIVLLPYERPLGNGVVFPGGDLREPISALKRGNIFVFTGAKAISKAEMRFTTQKACNGLEIPPDVSVFFSHTLVVGLRDMNGTSIPLDSLRHQSILAFCGLANPNAFYDSLKILGTDIKKTVSFLDHFAYKEEDVRDLLKLAEDFKCSHLVTTHKDMVKLKALSCLDNYSSKIVWLEIDIEIDTEFWGIIEHYLNIL